MARRTFGMITFYIRAEYKDTFEDFLDLIEKDDSLKSLRYKKNYGLLSIALSQLITQYVQKNEDKLKPKKKENAIPNKT